MLSRSIQKNRFMFDGLMATKSARLALTLSTLMLLSVMINGLIILVSGPKL